MRADRSEATGLAPQVPREQPSCEDRSWQRNPRQWCSASARNAASAAPPAAALRKRATTCWSPAAPRQKIDKVVDGDPQGRRRGHGRSRSTAPRKTRSSRLFDKAMADDADGAPADLLVFNMGNNAAVDFREMTAQHFEDSWRVGCFAGFLFGREAMRRLAPLGRGTVIFTGASGSLRGRPRSPPSTPPRAGCGCWSSRWRASSGRRASMSRT